MNLIHLGVLPGGDVDARPDRGPVALCPRQFDFDPVVLVPSIVAQQGRRVVHVEHRDIDVAVASRSILFPMLRARCPRSQERPKAHFFPLVGMLIAILIGLGLGGVANGQAPAPAAHCRACLHTWEILSLAQSFASAKGSTDSYLPVVNLAFAGCLGEAKGLVAFEENRLFVYALGSASWPGSGLQAIREPTQSPRWVRRVIVLMPSIFVVDDEVMASGSRVAAEWCLDSKNMPEVASQRARFRETGGELSCETMLPRKAIYCLSRPPSGEAESGRYLLEIASQDNPSIIRFLHVLHASAGGHQDSKVNSELREEAGHWTLTISTHNRIFRLRLPSPSESAGDIAISTADGKALLDDRPFPSGVLPHGPGGIRLLDHWDADYRGKQPPDWDIGRPSDELQKLVDSNTVRPRRVVDLCCGTGTDAIYLASRGFDVTAIDIAPTALSQAQQKARRAGVSVQWLLADVLAPPSLRPFDFIYDRGCYHVVRDQNLAAYLQALSLYSHPGTQFLLLAARRVGKGAGSGLPGVTEEELRYDFLPLFDLEWLREIRLESNRAGPGPPGWAALLSRKAMP